jgi:RNA polymerase-binding transcription factor DksA
MDKATASRRLEEERTRLQGIRDDLQRERSDATSETGDELSSVDQHPGDAGTETFEQVENELEEIETAFGRLERGEYGRCQACGRPIGDERLEAMPATRFCVEDQARVEREAGYPGSRA